MKHRSPSALLSHAARAAGWRERVTPGGRQPVIGLGNHGAMDADNDTQAGRAGYHTRGCAPPPLWPSSLLFLRLLKHRPCSQHATNSMNHSAPSALLSHAARAAGRRERVKPGAGSQSVAWGTTAGRHGRSQRHVGRPSRVSHAWVCTAAVAAFIVVVRERHRLNYAQTGGDPAPDGSSHAFSPLPGWSAAGVSGGKWAGSDVM